MDITIKQGTSFVVSITQIDDQVVGMLNDTIFANIRFGQPADAFELKNVFNVGDNYLKMLCINDSGPWVIGFTTTIDGVEIPELTQTVLGQDGKGLTYSFLVRIRVE